MAEQGLSQLELGHRLGHSSNGAVRQVLLGERPIPLGAMLAWADALRLTGVDRQEFLDEALISLDAPVLREFIRERDRLTAQVAALQQNVERLEAQLRQADVRSGQLQTERDQFRADLGRLRTLLDASANRVAQLEEQVLRLGR